MPKPPRKPPRRSAAASAEARQRAAAAAAEARPRLPSGALPPKQSFAPRVRPSSSVPGVAADIVRDAVRAEPFEPPPLPSVVAEFRERSLARQRDVLSKAVFEEERALAREDYWYFLTEVLFPLTWQQHYTEGLHRPDCRDLQNLRKGESDWGIKPRKRRKCLPDSTLVSMADGSLKTAAEIVVGDRVLGTLEDAWQVQEVVVEALERQPAQPASRVFLRSGRVVDVSSSHPFRNLLGWVDASDLLPGQHVAICGGKRFSTDEISEDEAALVGYLTGDGGTTQNSLSFTSADPGVVENLRAVSIRLGCSLRKRTSKYSYGLLGALPIARKHGVVGKKSVDKTISKVIQRSSRKSVLAFLGAWFDCDGGLGNGVRPDIRFFTSSRRLAFEGLHLLTTLGYAAEVGQRRSASGRQAYTIYLRGVEDLRRLIAEMPVHGRRVEQFRFVYGSLRGRRPDSKEVRMRRFPPEWRKLLPKRSRLRCQSIRVDNAYETSARKVTAVLSVVPVPELEAVLQAGILWDRIERVEPLGDLETIAIQTSGGTLLVEDILTHNSHTRHLAHSLWAIIRDPNVRYLSVGAREETVGPFARWIRDAFILGSNPAYSKFQELFPEFMLEPTGRNLRQAFQFTVPNRTLALADPTFRATYLGVTGAGWRADIINMDDVVERRNVSTPEMAQKTLVRMMDFFPLLDDTGLYANIIGSGTRWNYYDPYAYIIGETTDEAGAEEALALLRSRKVHVSVRHALEDPNRLCEICPKHIVLDSPHGHPSVEDGESIDSPVHSKQQVLDELESYRVNPQEGESQFWHQLMNVCLAPSSQQFQKEWFITLAEPTWRDVRRRVLSIDSADKNFQRPGVGDWMVALMGDWNERGKLVLRFGLRSNKWTREEFIRRILAWCLGAKWWPHLAAKEKFGTDNFLTQLCDAFISQGQPVRPVTIGRPQGLQKNDWIVDSLQAPLERSEVVLGSAFPPDLAARLILECVSLGQIANEDVADCLSCQMVPGVRVAAVDRLPGTQRQQWQPPALDLYETGLSGPAPATPAALSSVQPKVSPFEQAVERATATIISVDERGAGAIWDGAPPKDVIQIGLADYE